MPGGTELCVLSATGIQDPSGQIFANGSYQLVFKPFPTAPGPFVDTGISQAGPNFIKIFTGSLDATGSFSINNVVRNDSIAPALSKWALTVVPNANGQSYSVDLTLNSAIVDCTAAINAAITNIQVQAIPVAHAYKDSEVIPIPGSGGLYYDVTLKVLKIWDSATATWLSGTAVTPTGTGFTHITGGVQDAVAKIVDVSSADITGVLKAASFPVLTGDITTPGASLVTTLPVIVGASTNTKITFDAKGRVTAAAAAQLASADFVNQGTVSTVLHGNAAGNPNFGQVALGSEVSGSLPIGNQAAPTGTGFDHITAGARDAASKLVSLTASTDVAANQGTTTTVLHGNGAGQPSFAVVTPSDATGNTTGSGNFALATSPVLITPVIDTIIGPAGLPVHIHPGAAAAQALLVDSAAGAGTNLFLISNTGNASLAQPGTVFAFSGATSGQTNLAAAAIASGTITIPAGTDTLVALALIQTLTNKRFTPRIITMADATSVTPSSDTADENIFASTQVGGTLTINAPSGTPTDGQKLILRLKSTNAQTYSFNATYAFSTTVTAPTTLAAGKTDYIGLIWNATNTKWDVVAVDQGH